MDVGKIKFGENGLVPVIVQDCENGKVLMMAWANEEALLKTEQTGQTHFWSRSRGKLWKKGEESGNWQKVREIFVDCDHDCVLVLVEPQGPSCHTGEQTCFYTDADGERALSPDFGSSVSESGAMVAMGKVFQTVKDRKANPKKNSYTSALFEGGTDRIARKITEEAGETIIAAKNEDPDEIVSEMADLWFHCLIMLAERGLSPADIDRELENRIGVSGLEKKSKKP
ncbi:MAG: bifunctional phosphoribosyl-AMP cyclohydrolase/phosphoribosyl-ATP diphosphatase HisIE [Candidatus Mycalebacterium zealandia]|nr:MAG: bifunctional phosphoribosyl-AMP cyclohydrolase/phosphoribosyl-ATP diphosphatase HisIE [Candidatus Mycalebacterium zealandia]